MLCLLALFWPVRGSALVGATDGPPGANLAASETVFRTCDGPLPFSLGRGGLVTSTNDKSTSTLLMEQQFEASCNQKKAQRWQFCTLVLGAILWRRRRPTDARSLVEHAGLLVGAVAVAAAAVSAARALDLIYTSRFHILWVSVALYLLANAYWNTRRSTTAGEGAAERPAEHAPV